MTDTCPYCGSADTHPTHSIATTTAGVGAIGGIAAALTKTLSKGIPASGVVSFAASVVVNSLFSGLAGTLVGAKVGNELDRNLSLTRECRRCKRTYNPTKQLN